MDVFELEPELPELELALPELLDDEAVEVLEVLEPDAELVEEVELASAFFSAGLVPDLSLDLSLDFSRESVR